MIKKLKQHHPSAYVTIDKLAYIYEMAESTDDSDEDKGGNVEIWAGDLGNETGYKTSENFFVIEENYAHQTANLCYIHGKTVAPDLQKAVTTSSSWVATTNGH